MPNNYTRDTSLKSRGESVAMGLTDNRDTNTIRLTRERHNFRTTESQVLRGEGSELLGCEPVVLLDGSVQKRKGAREKNRHSYYSEDDRS
jgi:hypothetical protein